MGNLPTMLNARAKKKPECQYHQYNFYQALPFTRFSCLLASWQCIVKFADQASKAIVNRSYHGCRYRAKNAGFVQSLSCAPALYEKFSLITKDSRVVLK